MPRLLAAFACPSPMRWRRRPCRHWTWPLPHPFPGQELRLVGAADCVEVRLAGGGGSDIVTLSPVTEAGGVLFAPMGLTDMLNAGGAVLRSAP